LKDDSLQLEETQVEEGFYYRRGFTTGGVLLQEGFYYRSGFTTGGVLLQEGFYYRRGFTTGGVLLQEGFYCYTMHAGRVFEYLLDIAPNSESPSVISMAGTK